MATDVNNLRWRIGWSPWLVVIGVTVLFSIVGAAAEEIGAFFILGLLAGMIVWYWGVREINEKYHDFVQKFVGEAERNARRMVEIDDANLYNLTYGSGNSPPLVKASDTYTNTTIVVMPNSININEGAEYDMEVRDTTTGGTNDEIYYDQVTNVRSHQNGVYTVLEISTSGGDAIEITSNDTDTVDEVVSEVREGIRRSKSHRRRGRGQTYAEPNSDHEPPEPRSDSRSGNAPSNSASAEVDADDHGPAEGTDSLEEPSENTQELVAHPIEEVAMAVGERTNPQTSVASELCAVLADPSADEDRMEAALEDTIERLEATDSVVDTVSSIEDVRSSAQLEATAQTLTDRDGPVANAVEPLVGNLAAATRELNETDDTSQEVDAELERCKREYDQLSEAAGRLCREVRRDSEVTLEAEDVADRVTELVDALRSGSLVVEPPEPSVSGIASDIKLDTRPETPLSQDLLETLADPDDDVDRVLRTTVETLDECLELQKSVADIQPQDVRRRLESLDAELRREDGATYRHLADRIREFEATLDRGDVDGVRLYAIYQECTFYDRTLLPRLSRAGGSEQSTDVDRLLEDIEERIDTIEREYVSRRADHNHSIPRHFLSIADDLCDQASHLESKRPEEATGVVTAADELLAGVEELYERNEYSVMLRRLRG
ncbi:hypothetical protein ACYJ1Y_11135 [Natrialbaceae archaeon A-gly3]